MSETVLEMMQALEAGHGAQLARRAAAEVEEARQRRIDITAVQLFANSTETTPDEAYAAANALEVAREAFIAARKAGT